jgi:hypothetical protein
MKRKELRKEKEEDSILITALYRILCISFKITLQKCTCILVFALTHLPGTSKTGFREVKIMNEFV